MIIDAKDLIVGRLGTFVAKQALLGERIDVVNSELAVISGTREMVLEKYRHNSKRGVPAKGPYFIRIPDRFLKRLFRNMLPFKQERGKRALKGIKCWKGIPDQFKGKESEFLKVKGAEVKKLPHYRYVSVGEIVNHLGGKLD